MDMCFDPHTRHLGCRPPNIPPKGASPFRSAVLRFGASKGDGLTKTIAIFQLLWFSVQLIGRLVKGWAATELEVLTFAMCIMTVAIYYFWWNKPLDVHRQTVLEPIITGAEDVVDGNDSVVPEEDRKYRLSQHNFSNKVLMTFIQRRLSNSSGSSSFSRHIQPHVRGSIARYLGKSLPWHFFLRLSSFPFCFFGRRANLHTVDLIAHIQCSRIFWILVIIFIICSQTC